MGSQYSTNLSTYWPTIHMVWDINRLHCLMGKYFNVFPTPSRGLSTGGAATLVRTHPTVKQRPLSAARRTAANLSGPGCVSLRLPTLNKGLLAIGDSFYSDLKECKDPEPEVERHTMATEIWQYAGRVSGKWEGCGPGVGVGGGGIAEHTGARTSEKPARKAPFTRKRPAFQIFEVAPLSRS